MCLKIFGLHLERTLSLKKFQLHTRISHGKTPTVMNSTSKLSSRRLIIRRSYFLTAKSKYQTVSFIFREVEGRGEVRFITGGIFVSDNWGQGMFFVGGILPHLFNVAIYFDKALLSI